jgi:hypothetical protein
MAAMYIRCAAVFLLPVCGTAMLPAAEGVEMIASDWSPSGLGWLGIAAATASSSFGDGAQYAPSRAVDGQRGSKWVATHRPSREHPQWIALELFGSQEVSAVAVFGEAIHNDGIQDAQVQVAGSRPGEFSTVATVNGASSASWLATFEPVKTRAVRLLVTRSGGPSTHTDVYEVEVFGRRMPSAEWKAYAAERLDACTACWNAFLADVEKLGLRADSPGAGRADAAAGIENQRLRLAEQLSQWESLSEADRQTLVTRLERLEVRVKRVTAALAHAARLWPERSEELAAARESARKAAAGESVASAREGAGLRLANNRVSVVVDEADGSWHASWLGGMDAAVRHVGFRIEIAPQSLSGRPTAAEVAPFTDALGSGLQLRQSWGAGVAVERRIRVYHGKAAVVVTVQVTNGSDRDVTLGSARLLDLSEENGGWWFLDTHSSLKPPHAGSSRRSLTSALLRAPAAVGYPGTSPPCRPAPDEEATAGTETHYGSSGVLVLSAKDSRGGLALGFLSARQGSTSVAARFKTCEGGTALGATLSLGGRVLKPGQTLALDPVWLSVEDDRFDALERYGDAVAGMAPAPVRTGSNALWCSWYPLRMTISEEIVLAHAEIAARHFKPLGLNVLQLDHGWQRGDICGDWVPNGRFPHGLEWLSGELLSRFGLKLGLWIAPTQVAASSRLFREHPEWMAQGPDGQPARTGRWFWVPNPEMTVLDAGHPGAAKWIEETFGRLSAEGASYYKIDFIAGSPSLRRAMGAIRRGAGAEAWIRYCQTPPLLSVGLASSAYIGNDTGDAGLGDWMRLERANAPLLAASYWVNDRLYHREVCDMSVGEAAGVEEARFKLTLMTMSGCSISFSDDFRRLSLPRIRMMQQCLPPGNPRARPLDLFVRELPSLWHMKCQQGAGQWDAVGVFNFESQPQERTIELEALGMAAGAEVVAFEFWEQKLLGRCKDSVTLTLSPQTARIVLIHPLPARPRVIATNMHVLGGYHEIKRQTWNDQGLLLSGRYQRAAGLEGKGYVYVPDGFRPLPEAAATAGAARLSAAGKNLWVQDVRFDDAQLDWTVAFERASP